MEKMQIIYSEMMKKKELQIGSLPKRGATRCSLPKPPPSSGSSPKGGHRKQLSLGSSLRKSSIFYTQPTMKTQSMHTSVYSDFEELAVPFQDSITSIIDVSIGVRKLYQCLDTVLKYLFAAALRAHSHKSVCHLLDVSDKAPPDVCYLLFAISVQMLREGLPPSAKQAKLFRKFIRKTLREKGTFKSFREKQNIAKRNLIKFYGFFTKNMKLEEGDDIDGDHFGIDIIIEYVGSHFDFDNERFIQYAKWNFPDIGKSYVPNESTDSFCFCSRESSTFSFDIVSRSPNNDSANDNNNSCNVKDKNTINFDDDNNRSNTLVDNNNITINNSSNDLVDNSNNNGININNINNININNINVNNTNVNNAKYNIISDNSMFDANNTNRTLVFTQSKEPANNPLSAKTRRLKDLFNNWDTVYEATITVWDIMQNDRDFDVQELISALSFPYAVFLMSALNAFKADSGPP